MISLPVKDFTVHDSERRVFALPLLMGKHPYGKNYDCRRPQPDDKKENYLDVYKMFRHSLCTTIPKKAKDPLKEFDSFIGMQNVKDQIATMKKSLGVPEMKEKFIKEAKNHVLLIGHPGTGKTVVARVIAKALFELGLIPEDKITEVTSTDCIAGYVGQTALKTRALIEKAYGGVLFIDEAHSFDP